MGRYPRKMTPVNRRAKLRGDPYRAPARQDEDTSTPGFNIPGSQFNFDQSPATTDSSPSSPESDFGGFGGGDSGGGGASSDW